MDTKSERRKTDETLTENETQPLLSSRDASRRRGDPAGHIGEPQRRTTKYTKNTKRIGPNDWQKKAQKTQSGSSRARSPTRSWINLDRIRVHPCSSVVNNCIASTRTAPQKSCHRETPAGGVAIQLIGSANIGGEPPNPREHESGSNRWNLRRKQISGSHGLICIRVRPCSSVFKPLSIGLTEERVRDPALLPDPSARSLSCISCI